MFGWRGRVGHISPASMELTAYDFYNVAPEGVGLVGYTCNMEGWSDDQYDVALAEIDNAAVELASRGVDFISHGGAPMVVNSSEPFFDQKIIDRLQDLTGIPATTSIRTGIDALQHLDLSRIVLATPYHDKLNSDTARYLETYGIDVVHTTTLSAEFKSLHSTPPGTIYDFVMESAAAAPDADGLYLPCPQWCVCDLVEVLEQDCGKPVVAASPALWWTAFRALGVAGAQPGYGRLLSSL